MGAVLQAKDVGLLVGLTEDAVKQWTLGRPYTIRPSIRSSAGKGIPNLYNLSDALRFYVVRQLTADGFQSFVIQRALAAVDSTAKTLLISRGAGSEKPEVEFSKLSMAHLAKREEADTRAFVERSFYLLDLESLRTDLDHRWMEFLRDGVLQGANPIKKRRKKP
jgi:hypothetical protein